MFNFRINAAVREYFNYRYDDASFQLEEAKLNGLSIPMERDFRTRKQRQEDDKGRRRDHKPAFSYQRRAIVRSACSAESERSGFRSFR